MGHSFGGIWHRWSEAKSNLCQFGYSRLLLRPHAYLDRRSTSGLCVHPLSLELHLPLLGSAQAMQQTCRAHLQTSSQANALKKTGDSIRVNIHL